MPFKLWHGDYVDDTGSWCPVCFNLSYENLESRWPRGVTKRVNKASPGKLQKGLLAGFSVWWRARYDFQHCAEQYKCVYCAVLFQIVDRLWRRPKPRLSSRPTRSYELTVFKDGSVEVQDFDGLPSHCPTKLILFTPSGIEHLPIQRV